MTIYARRIGDTSRNDLAEPTRYRHPGTRRPPRHPLDYPCVVCRSLPGRPCRANDGHPMGDYHYAREQAAR